MKTFDFLRICHIFFLPYAASSLRLRLVAAKQLKFKKYLYNCIYQINICLFQKIFFDFTTLTAHCRLQYPDTKFDDDLQDHLLLYRHDIGSVNILQLITRSSDITDNALIEVIISCKLKTF